MSDRGSRSGSPRACSGLIEVGVPADEALPGHATLPGLDACQAEVGDLGPSRPVVDQDIAWLDVAMDQAGGVGGVQGVGDLGHPGRNLPRLGPVHGGDPFTQGPTRDVLHHQVRQAIRRVDHGVDHHDVIVLEAGGMLGLADQALPVGLFGLVGPEHLDSDQPMQRSSQAR